MGYLDPAKDIICFLVGAICRQSSKKQQQTILVRNCITSALVLSLLRHFGVMFGVHERYLFLRHVSRRTIHELLRHMSTLLLTRGDLPPGRKESRLSRGVQHGHV